MKRFLNSTSAWILIAVLLIEITGSTKDGFGQDLDTIDDQAWVADTTVVAGASIRFADSKTIPDSISAIPIRGYLGQAIEVQFVKQHDRYLLVRSRDQQLAWVPKSKAYGPALGKKATPAIFIEEMQDLDAQIDELRAAAKYAEAIAVAEELAEIALQRGGPFHDEYAAVLLELFQIYYSDLDQPDRAKIYAIDARKIYETTMGKQHWLYAHATTMLAQACGALQEFDQAEGLFSESQSILIELGQTETGAYGNVLSGIADLQFERGHYEDARQNWEAGRAIYETVYGVDSINYGRLASNLGLVHKKLGKYKEAQSWFDRALQIFEAELGADHPDCGVVKSNLAGTLGDLGQFEQAETLFLEAIQISANARGKDSIDHADKINNLADLYRSTGKLKVAEHRFKQSLDITESALGDDHPSVATSLDNLATVYTDQGRILDAQPLYERAAKIRKSKLGTEHPAYAMSQMNLAGIAHRLGNLETAETLFLEALKIQQKALGERHPEVAVCQHNLAALNIDLGRLGEAEARIEKAIAIKTETFGAEHPTVATSMSQLGLLHRKRGNLEQAEKIYRDVLSIRQQRLGVDHPDCLNSVNNLAILLQAQGELEEAERLLTNTRDAIAGSLGKLHPDYLTVTGNLGQLYSRKKKFEQAKQLFQEVIDAEQAKHGNASLKLGILYNNLGAMLREQQKFDEAIALHEQALDIIANTFGTSHPSYENTLAMMARVELLRGNGRKVIALTDRARRAEQVFIHRDLKALPTQQQLTYLADQFATSMAHDLSLAFHFAETPSAVEASTEWLVNYKGTGHEALAASSVASRNSSSKELLDKLADVREQIARTAFRGYANQDAADRDPGQLSTLLSREKELIGKIGESAGQWTKPDWIEIDEIRNQIPEDSVLISFLSFEPKDFSGTQIVSLPRQYFAWVIPPAGQQPIKVIKLGSAEVIDAQVAKYREKVGGSYEDVIDELRALDNLVFSPLLPVINDASKLIISPDSQLWVIPWNALVSPNGSFRIEAMEFQFSISGRDLLSAKTRTSTTAPVVFADPDYDAGTGNLINPPVENSSASEPSLRKTRAGFTGEYGRLSGTLQEAKAIAPLIKRYSGQEVMIYLRREATETQFKQLKSPQIVVIGTHGFFDAEKRLNFTNQRRTRNRGEASDLQITPLYSAEENPLLHCGVVLAGCNVEQAPGVEDGILSGLEIVGADLAGTELVVLSACETGLGDIRNGEGVAGLRQAFQLAGARQVVASLWQVPDEETARLMVYFWNDVAAGKTKSAALRDAQLKIIAQLREREDEAHPFYWAAFTLTGNG